MECSAGCRHYLRSAEAAEILPFLFCIYIFFKERSF
nr:MAG TPA: hypothetical protein [Caudoviricetes sp.]